MVLPAPDHRHGYREDSLKALLGERWEAFLRFVETQTVLVEPDDAAVYFTGDVARFLEGRQVVE